MTGPRIPRSVIFGRRGCEAELIITLSWLPPLFLTTKQRYVDAWLGLYTRAQLQQWAIDMGELHDAVTALLDAFARGISVIRAQHSRRKEQLLPVDPVQQTAETHVRKSLKKSRADVKEAYTRDLARYGPRFAAGDGTFSPTITAAVSSAHRVKARSGDGALADVSAAEARSAFSSILLRLNAAFMSIIERFTKGRSTREDYRE